MIRGWRAAVNPGDCERAADYFADGAIVKQVTEIELAKHADAVAFNRSLPCRVDGTDVDERDGSTLAAFRLKEGSGGECAEGGDARARFVVANGEIEEWRQLPEPAAPSGELA